MSPPLLAGSLWALGLLGACFGARQWLPTGRAVTHRGWLIVGAVALAVRLLPNLVLPVGAGYDIESFQIVGDLVRAGREVYASPDTVNRHPYLPLQMYWMAAARWGAGAFDLPFVKVVRLAPIAADAGIAILLYQSLRRRSSDRDAFFGGMFYALNPVPIFVSAYHGQFDAIPALLTLLALASPGRSSLGAGGWLGLGILNKSWPVLALPSLALAARGWPKKLLLLGLAILIPLAGVGLYAAVFGADPRAVLGRALSYNWGGGVWGYAYFFRLLSIFRPAFTVLFYTVVDTGRYLTLAALGLVWWFRARHESPGAGILTVLVAFLAVTHAFSIQYLMWVVPFAVLNQDYRWLWRYTLGAFAYMFLTYTTLILEMHITQWLPWPQADWFIIMPAGLPAWLVTVGWATKRVVGTAQE